MHSYFVYVFIVQGGGGGASATCDSTTIVLFPPIPFSCRLYTPFKITTGAKVWDEVASKSLVLAIAIKSSDHLISRWSYVFEAPSFATCTAMGLVSKIPFI